MNSLQVVMPVATKSKNMVSDYRCYFCFVKAFEKLLLKEELADRQKSRFTFEMAKLYQKNWQQFSAPRFARELHSVLRSYSGNQDPFKDEKRISNDLVMKMYPELKITIKNSCDPFETALRLSIAGNIIDFATSTSYDLNATINKVLNSDFAIDHSIDLKESLTKAKTVLYLGDNCGEIVFDKLFIETINHPNLIYAVRGEPVINDATLEDAEYVELTKVCKVISNGYDAPSTVLNKCSKEFLEIYQKADIIISKGQGNLEGLLPEDNKQIFFLLMVKCDVIADALSVKKGDFVVKRNFQK